MDLRHLRYFLAVADAGHITRAAEALGIQQPPLSQQIRALEAELGCTLFHRLPRGVSLTAAGRLLAEDARRLLGDADGLLARMRRVGAGEEGELSVAFTSSASAHGLAPALLRRLRQDRPGIRVQVREHNAAEIMEGVKAGHLDAGLLRRLVAEPEGLSVETLLEEEMVLALPQDHPLARRARPGAPLARLPSLPLEALRDETFLLVRRPGAPGMYGDLLALCGRLGFAPRIGAEVERMMTNLNLVAAGAGVSVVPASMRDKESGNVAYFRLRRDQRLAAPLTLVYRAGPGNAALDALVQAARQAAAALRKAAGNR
ncbi:LysR family transcriptional regulator [Achromobacter sp. Marseille-Q4962]|uniref:LysR family transcriptional regulator n=1 Tax=Achromobacter sp. Marseille-Q4962 TaxID=2942202 RepID=UPI0020736F74|nr:LysR family transcriptional regulator [Achromobacter sp. Marseille-Q4962]